MNTLPRRLLHLSLGLAIAVAAAGCSDRHAPSPSATSSGPPMLLDERGTIMSPAKLRRNVDLRPFIPVPNPLAYAALPGLGGPDTPANRGVGIEYVAPSGTRMILSEWPKQNYQLNFISKDLSTTPCVPVIFMHENVAWTSKRGAIMTLIADGSASRGAIEREARRLLARGACTR